MQKMRSAERPAPIGKDDTRNVKCTVTEVNSSSTLGRSIQSNWGRIHQDALNTAEDNDRLMTVLEAATLENALRTGGMALGRKGSYTCFVPTEKAFSLLSRECGEATLRDPEKLAYILKYHTVQGKLMYRDFLDINSVKTLAGKELSVDASEGVRIGGAAIIKSDIETANGVIHIIDTVLTH